MARFETLRVKNFLSELGSKKGAPGGGAAAALTGATGCALVEMVARLNDARLGRSSGNVRRARLLRQKFQRLMDEDAKAFGAIQKIYRKRRTERTAWKRVLKNGAAVPLRVAELCAAAAKFVSKERPRTSPWLISDLKESAILLDAASRSARLNVEINLKEIEDPRFVSRMRKQLNSFQ